MEEGVIRNLDYCFKVTFIKDNFFYFLFQFLKLFPSYEFNPEEIDALFESIVWPMVSWDHNFMLVIV